MTPRVTAAGQPIPEGHVRCSACRGWGFKATSANVGGGCLNDTCSDCWACLGRGYKPAESEREAAA